MGDHAGHAMDHSQMDHSKMDHSKMDHSAHAGHNMDAMDMASAVVNATLSAATTAASEVVTAMHKHMTGEMDHSGHDHSGHDHGDHSGHDHGDHSGHQMAGAQMGGHDHGQHAAAGGHGGHSGMAMTFHFGVSEYVLFDAWHVTTVSGMVASCLGLFLIALLYEGLKYKREDLLRKNATRDQFDTIRVPSEGGVTEVTSVTPSQYGGATADPTAERGSDSGESAESRPITAAGRQRLQRQRMLSKHHFLQTFLHAVQVVVGYMLMLAFMTYNVWLGLAITLGAAAGYFIFGSKKFVVVDVTEHCH